MIAALEALSDKHLGHVIVVSPGYLFLLKLGFSWFFNSQVNLTVLDI